MSTNNIFDYFSSFTNKTNGEGSSWYFVNSSYDLEDIDDDGTPDEEHVPAMIDAYLVYKDSKILCPNKLFYDGIEVGKIKGGLMTVTKALRAIKNAAQCLVDADKLPEGGFSVKVDGEAVVLCDDDF